MLKIAAIPFFIFIFNFFFWLKLKYDNIEKYNWIPIVKFLKILAHIIATVLGVLIGLSFII